MKIMIVAAAALLLAPTTRVEASESDLDGSISGAMHEFVGKETSDRC